jgi:dual specificity MAP kinase phosphatase
MTETIVTTQKELVIKDVDFSKFPSIDDAEDVKYNMYFRANSTMDMIIPRLFLSDDVAARNKKILDENKITHILNLTTNIPNKYDSILVYKKLIILDFESQNIRQYFEESFEFIDEALKNEKNSVLVHCNAGVSRSASFVIAYLMQKQIFKTYKNAYNHVKGCRPIISPNKGFERQLIVLEHKIKRKNKKMCDIM